MTAKATVVTDQIGLFAGGQPSGRGRATRFGGSSEASSDGRYRWTLVREWTPELPRLGWIMLNPSTADHCIDDPTTTKTIGFATRWRFGSAEIVNAFGYRTAYPKVLLEAVEADRASAVGDEANHRIVDLVTRCSTVVLAWGGKCPRWRALEVVTLVEEAKPLRLLTLGYTTAGHPMHPLMVSYSTLPVDYRRTGVLRPKPPKPPSPAAARTRKLRAVAGG